MSTVVDVNHFSAQYIGQQTNGEMKQINDILSGTLIPFRLTSIEINMICTALFILESARTTTPNNNQFGKRYQYYRGRIIHRIDNVTLKRFLC